jgi:hypothetical protein
MLNTPPNTPRRLVLLALALMVVGTACASAQSFELKRVQRPNVKVLPGRDGFVHPLTGVVYFGPQPWQQRPAVGIKVGNSANERPQAGLDKADLIYEEIVEGGVTRFLAVFSTQSALRVGPVRSVRTVDPKVMQPIGGLFGYSGGVPPIIAALRAVPNVTDAGANRDGAAYHRDPNRSMPYNLYTSTDRLWAAHQGTPPSALFDFLRPSEDATKGGDQAANNVRLSFAGNSSQVRYTYVPQTGRYGRYIGNVSHDVEGSTPGGRTQLGFRNVIVQFVGVSAGSTIDRAGERTNDIRVIGSGSVVIFRGGRAFRGHWSRTSVSQATHFTDASGGAIRLAPGNTIVELLPQGRDIFVT